MKLSNALIVVFALSLMQNQASFGQLIEDRDDFSYDGFLEASQDVMVSALEIGRVETVSVKVGDRIEAGQEIATLENATQVISVEIAKYQASMRGDIEAAVAERNLNLSRTEQLRVLAAMGTARPDELTRAETDLMLTEAKVLAALEEQQNRVLEHQRQEIQLQRRRILSPLTGVVASVVHQPGEYISPGDASIARIIAKDTLVAVFNLPASDAIQLRIEQRVPVRPRTVPRVVNGVVESISPAIDGESGTVAVRVRVDNLDESLFPGDRCLLENVRLLQNSKQAIEQPMILRQVNR